MRIAVTSQNYRAVTGHAGRARHFIVFEADGQEPSREVERLDLDTDMAIHGFDHRAAHPLDSMNVLITGGAGAGFIQHLAARGVLVVATEESDPGMAVEAFISGRVKSPGEGCNHNHGDLDDDDHAHTDGQGHTCNCHG